MHFYFLLFIIVKYYINIIYKYYNKIFILFFEIFNYIFFSNKYFIIIIRLINTKNINFNHSSN